MNRALRAGLILAVLLGLLCLALLSDLARKVSGTPLRLVGEEQWTQAIAQLNEPLVITWYASPDAQFSGDLRLVPDAIERLVELSQARFARVDPSSDPQLSAHTARLGLSPMQVRTIERDGWSERSLWSTLRIVVGSRGAIVMDRVGAEEAPQLCALAAARLEQLREPRRARVGLSAPANGFRRLEQALANSCELFLLDFDTQAQLPEELEVLFWMAPRQLSPTHLLALRDFRARGGELVLARASDNQVSPVEAQLYQSLGARLESELLQEPEAPLVRSIASDQDFRRFGAQPNGTLGFLGAHALVPEPAQLAALRANWEVLASSSAPATPGASLLVRIAALDAGLGSSLLLASASPLEDTHLEHEAFAHRQLLETILRSIADPARHAAARIQARQFEALPELSSFQRNAWRGVLVLGLPLLLLSVAWWRRRHAPPSQLHASAWLRPMAWASAGLVLVAMVAALAPAHEAQVPTAVRQRVTQLLQNGPLELRWSISERERLPAPWRAPLARFERQLRELAALDERVRLVVDTYPALDAEQRARLEQSGLRSTWATQSSTEGDLAREIVASLQLRQGERSTTLELSDSTRLETLEFPLALALERLLRATPIRIAWASDRLRLSPAESRLNYQERGLFAPGGSDPYPAAKARLRALGFELVIIDPTLPPEKLDADLLVWLQPRRSSAPMQALLRSSVRDGIPALVASQNFVAQSRARSAQGLSSAWWPEPQFADLEQGWLADAGIEWVREVVFDAQSARADMESVVERHGTRQLERASAANPLFVRVAAEGLRPSELQSVGSLRLAQPSWIRVDEARLRAAGFRAVPRLLSSARTWTYNWQGGELEARWFEATGQELRGPLPLAIELVPLQEQAEARLLLLGSARMFQDAELEATDADNAAALAEWCTRLCGGADLAELLVDRNASPGLRWVEPKERIGARILVLGLGPLLLCLYALWRQRAQRGVWS